MFKKFPHRLQYCHDVALSMSKASTMQLQQLKAQLAAEMGAPVGIHTMGIPAAFSTLGITISLAIPQLWLGYLMWV